MSDIRFNLRRKKDEDAIQRKEAQSIVEFALVLPVLLLLIFGIIEFARIFQSWLVVTNAARIGMRYAVTGAYETHFCTDAIDSNGNGLVCGQEPDKDARVLEEDQARLLSIYEVTTNSAAGILRNSAITTKGTPGYFHVTVCTTSGGHVYHPLPDDYCEPSDHPGDPSEGPARVLVAVTYEHPLILPLVSNIRPSVTLHAERTGILEQFRVARVLGLPPDIELPTATPAPTNTPTPTLTLTPTATPDCSLYTLGQASIEQYNRYRIAINNASSQNVRITYIGYDWSEAEKWADALGKHDIRVDWFQWNGSEFYSGNDYDSPTNVGTNLLLSAGTSGDFFVDFDFAGESGYEFMDWGITGEQFGLTVNLDNGCSMNIVPTELPLPTPQCDLYSIYSSGFFDNYAVIYLNARNDDMISAQLTGVNIDWSYAEGMDALKDPDDDLNLDWMKWGTSVYGTTIWGNNNGNERDYDSPTNTGVDSPSSFVSGQNFDPGLEYYISFDFDNEWSDWYTDLLPEDFAVTLNFDNGCSLTWSNVPRPLPTPDCTLYSLSEFEFYNKWNRIRIRATNGDAYPTRIERIVLDWDYADQVSDLILGGNLLNLDWMSWDGSYIWSNNDDNVRDYASTTDTQNDSPSVFYGPDDFNAGDTVRLDVDFDFQGEYQWAFNAWGVQPSDFGVTMYFENGCVLEKSAADRPIATPTPDCSDIYADRVRFHGDDFEIEVQNDNIAPAYLIDSTLYWPGPSGNSYVNYFRFNWITYYNGNDYDSPTSAAPSSGMMLNGIDDAWWEADFNNGLPYGHYRGVLTFEYPDWGVCTVEAELDLIAPTNTPTENPNATPTPTRTLKPTETNTPTPSITYTPSDTFTPTNTPTPTRTPTPSRTPTRTPTRQPPTPTRTPPPATNTPIPTQTNEPTPTSTLPGGG